MEHTKGNWTTKEEDKTPHGKPKIYIVAHRYVAEALNWSSNSGDDINNALTEEAKANARLIAAAPDLLEAGELADNLLQKLANALFAEGLTHIFSDLKEHCKSDPNADDSTMDKLRQAIAKAKP